MTMYEAALAVLKDHGSPMHARDIYEEIVRRQLFSFGAKNPVSVLSQTLREKSGVGRGKGDPLFERTAPGTYGLAKR